MIVQKEIDEAVSTYIKEHEAAVETMKMDFGEKEYISCLRSAAKLALISNDY